MQPPVASIAQNSTFLSAAMQRSSGSAGRPADHCADSSDPPDYMESPGWVDWTLTEWAEWENPGLELSGLEPERLLEPSNCSSENRESSAARLAPHHGTENTEDSAARPAY